MAVGTIQGFPEAQIGRVAPPADIGELGRGGVGFAPVAPRPGAKPRVAGPPALAGRTVEGGMVDFPGHSEIGSITVPTVGFVKMNIVEIDCKDWRTIGFAEEKDWARADTVCEFDEGGLFVFRQMWAILTLNQ